MSIFHDVSLSCLSNREYLVDAAVIGLLALLLDG